MTNLVENTTAAKVFLTDYNSYNNGTQYEFGHWVELDQFADEFEFSDYVVKHFKEADKKSPIDGIREEIMITDFEGFPKDLYCECASTMEDIFLWINLDEDEKIKVEYLCSDLGYKIKDALEKTEDLYFYEDHSNLAVELFKEYYPEADKADDNCYYLKIDYDQFMHECFNQFEAENGNTYYFPSDF